MGVGKLVSLLDPPPPNCQAPSPRPAPGYRRNPPGGTHEPVCGLRLPQPERPSEAEKGAATRIAMA
jgi:hypothetical protein